MLAPGTLYVISAPSGAGKTSLVRHLIEKTPGVEVSVSHTTRPPRPGERDGVDYFFVDVATFRALVKKRVFLEHARVFGNFYGTSGDAVRRRLAQGIDILLEIDWQGARQVRQLMPGSRTVFVLPPGLEELRRRLKGRGQDSDTVVQHRMHEAVREISHYHEFDYIVVNDDFQCALEALSAIIIANRQLRAAQVARYRDLISSLLS